ncbi:MAG: hypothetical protein ACQEXJ_03980 [Myxococcota bacterium]
MKKTRMDPTMAAAIGFLTGVWPNLRPEPAVVLSFVVLLPLLCSWIN